ncbi:helix-turn-helix domain-containing protein [Chitinophaga sp. GCM10012297]|uniref:AraC family transcriptional regulator n=1 Tax=Chitinophaga chungangae TaxID=2821488 RepID=A0ABS3YC82_9BACT|nr:helix-turn-helix domain-containing protein [Chitinophaga chungangae]MBO9151749.1 AraC family transcriptional regulator [Chitinophaga chungangae]
MEKPKSAIPYYNDINEFLASIDVAHRTANPVFYCLRLAEHKENIYRPPFRRSFYFVGLFTDAAKSRVTHGGTNETSMSSYMVFQSPELLYSFYRDKAMHGYVFYFQPECFSFFRPDFQKEFPFFDVLHTSLFRFDHVVFEKLAPHFEEVFAAYERSGKDQHVEARVKLLALLYHLKEFAAERMQGVRMAATPQQVLLKKYMQLVNNYYIDKRTVQEYADMLAVTPNYLSQSVKAVSGKNALSYISERLLTEAKSLLQHTHVEIAEIAYQLNFSDPANFGKFFRAQAGMSPSEFRKQDHR